MRLGINWVPPHGSEEDWAEKLHRLGCRATVFPVDHRAPVHIIDRYAQAAKARDLCIAEVGVWNSLVSDDPAQAAVNYSFAKGQLELANYVHARCCVNVSGATGPMWFMPYSGNYQKETFDRNVEILQRLLDEVKPRHTYYALEMMQWMIPDSPQSYARILDAVGRERLAVHVDVVNLVRGPETYLYHNRVIDETFVLLGGQIKSCHLKDLLLPSGVTLSFAEVPPGQGVIDLAHYGRKINEQGEDIPLLIEHLDSFEAYSQAMSYVSALYQSRGIAH